MRGRGAFGGSPSRGGRGGSSASRGGPREGGFRGGRGAFGAPRGGSGPRGGGFRGGSRGSSRGGRGGMGARPGNKVIVVPSRFKGCFLVKGKADFLATRNMVPGVSVYGEKRIEITEGEDKIEYRVWNPVRSKLGAAIVGGVLEMPIAPGSKVLYLGAANGTTVSHVSDLVGPEGVVYAVEFSHRSGRDLTDMAKKRPNIVPIVEDARMPARYRMLVGMVDVIFADVAQPDQSRIVALNAYHFLKPGGSFMIAIKANCVDSTAAPEAVYASELDKLRKENCKASEQLSIDAFHRDHCILVGKYRK